MTWPSLTTGLSKNQEVQQHKGYVLFRLARAGRAWPGRFCHVTDRSGRIGLARRKRTVNR